LQRIEALFNKTATEVILLAWNRLNSLPGGIWIFNLFLRWFNPYSGSIRAFVTELRPGYARLALQDRRRVRNHLNSIHALALANLGELTSGLALLSGLPGNSRGIPTKITTEYFKKARGKLTAECHSGLPEVNETIVYEVFTDILNGNGEIVARTVVNWRISPVEYES
jgi:acyl-coenzyme A thioesterase PaaI-like protein